VVAHGRLGPAQQRREVTGADERRHPGARRPRRHGRVSRASRHHGVDPQPRGAHRPRHRRRLSAPGSEDVNRLVGINRRGQAFEFAVDILNDAELAGATFSPDGDVLFVNILGDGSPGSGMTDRRSRRRAAKPAPEVGVQAGEVASRHAIRDVPVRADEPLGDLVWPGDSQPPEGPTVDVVERIRLGSAAQPMDVHDRSPAVTSLVGRGRWPDVTGACEQQMEARWGQSLVEGSGMSADDDGCVREAVTGAGTVAQARGAFEAAGTLPVTDGELCHPPQGRRPSSSGAGGELEGSRSEE
jgi:hypothetical protein